MRAGVAGSARPTARLSVEAVTGLVIEISGLPAAGPGVLCWRARPLDVACACQALETDSIAASALCWWSVVAALPERSNVHVCCCCGPPGACVACRLGQRGELSTAPLPDYPYAGGSARIWRGLLGDQ